MNVSHCDCVNSRFPEAGINILFSDGRDGRVDVSLRAQAYKAYSESVE